MPIGYLETVGPVALFTLAVLWPPRRPAGLARVVFVLTHLLNEAPVIGWIWLLTSTALAVAGGQLTSIAAAAVAALAVFTTAGLIEVTRRGLRTSRVAQEALDRALGPTAGPIHQRSLRQQVLRAIREVLLPVPWRPRRVRRIRNLRYGPHGRHNLLDLYVSRDQHAAPRPVLIHFHGGHFEVGGKSREALPLLHRFAAQGWLCISANYRLGSAGRFPRALIDAKQVIAWARSPAATSYRADPATLIVAGSSAGAHLAAMAALTINDPDYQPGFEHDDTTVTGAVCLYGYYGDLDTGGLLPSTPQAHVRRDAPPFMIVHGANDTLVPLPDATSFADQLASTSASPVVCLTLPGALHSFDLLHSPRFDNVLDGIDTFTAAVLRCGTTAERLADVVRPATSRRPDDAGLPRRHTGRIVMDAPQLQHRFVTDVLPRIQQDARVAGVAIAGSLARGNPDVYSDVDLVVVIEDSAFESVMSERFALIDAWRR